MTSPRKPLSDRSQQLMDTARHYYVPNYKPREMIIDRAEGARVYDLEGNDYIDLGTGIAVTSLGHCHPDLVNALDTQMRKIWHTSNVYYTEPPIQLAKTLVEATPFAERVFFCNSGAEANEAAIKLVRKYASLKYPESKREIITFHGSFHGRTLATVTATAQPKYQQGFEPLPGGFTYCAYNDFDAIAAAINENTCAVMLEPIQGEGGITPFKPGFLNHIRQLCDKVDALLVVDEIQCGMGRTGKLFGHMQEAGFTPDVMTLAKALGGGFPIGAMLVGEKAKDVLQFGSHGTTFGGNPMACAVANTIMQHLQSPALLAHVETQGEAIRNTLREWNKELALFKEVRGMGLMIGAELVEDHAGKAGDIGEIARAHGVLILQAGPNVLRLLPPLNLTDAEREEGMARLLNTLRDYVSK